MMTEVEKQILQNQREIMMMLNYLGEVFGLSYNGKKEITRCIEMIDETLRKEN